MNFEMRTQRTRVGVALGALALATLAWSPNVAAEPVGIARLLGDAATHNRPSFRVVLGLTGTTVSVDPETGRLRQPTAGEMAALTQAMAARFAHPEHVTYEQAADGTITAHLGEAGLNVAIATVGADGQLRQTCVDDPAAAAALLASGVTLEEQ
jgi:3,4-dihydroxy-2-butanone 4-phosphate synthase